MTLEELNAILALPGTSVGKNGNTSTASKKGDLIMQGVPFPGGAPIVAQGPRQHPLVNDPMQFANNASGMEALGMTADGRGINEPVDGDIPMDQAPAMAVDGTAARNLVVEPAGGPMPAPEFFGAESLMSSGPMDITPQGYTDESKRTPSMSKWDQFMSRPGMGNALLAMGGAMLSGKSPADAFGGGITAFGNTLEARRLNDLQQQNAEQDRLMRLMAARAKATPQTAGEKLQDQINARMEQGKNMGLEGDALRGYALEGKLPTPKSASELKLERADNEALGNIALARERITQARSFLPDMYHGFGAGLAGQIGANVPFGDKVFDRKRAVATEKYSNLMSQGAIQTMAETLKGATTNFEMDKFIHLLASTDVSREVKEMLLNDMDKALDIAEARVRDPSMGRYTWDFSKYDTNSNSSGGGNTGTPAPNNSSVRSRADAILSGN